LSAGAARAGGGYPLLLLEIQRGLSPILEKILDELSPNSEKMLNHLSPDLKFLISFLQFWRQFSDDFSLFSETISV
jgi:hypothetical protein